MSVTPILTRALRYGALLALAVAVVAGVIGLLVAGVPGLLGGLFGALLAAVFLGITACSMLFAGWVAKGDSTSPTFFGIVLGVWVLKLVVFVVAAIVLGRVHWVDPYVFFFSVIAAVIGSLLADILAFLRARVPYVSDVALPGETPRSSGARKAAE
jgi:hypothetical protein